MLIEPDDWKREWGADNLVFATEHVHCLPDTARAFLSSYGMPRRIIFENPLDGDWDAKVELDYAVDISFEISFEPLLRPLERFNAAVRWGDFYNEELDKAWSEQIVIGEEEFSDGHASYCVHQLSEAITRIDVDREKETFVNSSLPQYGESLLLAVRWSNAFHQAGLGSWETSLNQLADALEAIDAVAFQRNDSEWPRLISYARDNEPGFLEITADPTRSRPRF